VCCTEYHKYAAVFVPSQGTVQHTANYTHTHTLNIPNYGIKFATELFITKYTSIYAATEMR